MFWETKDSKKYITKIFFGSIMDHFVELSNFYTTLFFRLQRVSNMEEMNQKKGSQTYFQNFMFSSWVFAQITSELMRLKALAPYFAFFAFASIYEHFASMYGPLIPHIKIVKMVKNHNFGHYDDDSCRCSWSARRCSWHSKMQNVDQGLSNAPILKHFRLLTAEKSNFKIMKILWFSEYFLVYFGGRHCPTCRSGYEKAQNRWEFAKFSSGWCIFILNTSQKKFWSYNMPKLMLERAPMP